MKDVVLNIKRGKLTAIVGQVGSGKSSLLQAMLGEMEVRNGSINTAKDMKIAYVAQLAWIQNLTLRDNILFDQSFNRRKYSEAIENCALTADLEMLANGDQTEIGENGINLSGGQKQRVSLARALYSESDIYLLDDPLSAVDAHVGKHIFAKVLDSKTGALKEKTRVIATNSLDLLKNVDYVIVLKDGRISEQGPYQELIDNRKDFANFLAQFVKVEEKSNPTPAEDSSKSIPIRYERTTSVSSETVYGTTPNRLLARSLSIDPEFSSPRRRLSRRLSHDVHETVEAVPPAVIEEPFEEADEGRLIEEEAAETGRVKMGVYFEYAKSIGLFGALSAVFFVILGQLLHTLGNLNYNFYNKKHIFKSVLQATFGFQLGQITMVHIIPQTSLVL